MEGRHLKAKVESSQIIAGWAAHTVYVVSVTWQTKAGATEWKVNRRFSEFDSLCNSLLQEIKVTLPSLPPKTFFSNTDPDFVSNRRKDLDVYLQQLTYIDEVCKCQTFMSFLNVDDDKFRTYLKESQLMEKGRKHRQVTIDDFELLKVIGRGSFGKVMQVRKKDTGTVYAMKILKKVKLVAANQIINTKTERHLLKSLKHPFLISLQYAFQTKEKLYMVIDYMLGGELFFHLSKGKFNEERATFYTAELVLAFEFLHTKGIIYRDLKPENVLLDADGRLSF